MKYLTSGPSAILYKFILLSSIKNRRLLLILLIIVGTILRIPTLGESLWYDELVYSTKYVMTSWSDLWRLFLFDTPAPLYRVVMFIWVTIFGEQELILRIPSLLFGIISILFTYLIAETFGYFKIAIFAALLLCLSPVHIWYSQEATPYSMTLCFLLATVYFFRKFETGHFHWTGYILYFVCFLIAIFTHYYAAMFLFPLSLLAFTAYDNTRKKILIIHLTLFLCLITFLAIKYMLGHVRTGMVLLRPFTLFELWMLFFNWFSNGNSILRVNPYLLAQLGIRYLMSQKFLVVFQLIFFITLVRGLLLKRGQIVWKETLELSLFLFSMPLVMLFVTHVCFLNLYIERYLILILPFFFIVIARGASGYSNKYLNIAIMLFFIIASVYSCTAFYYKNNSWTVYKQNPDWRGAAYYLLQKNHNLEKLAIVSVTGHDCLKYYLRKEGVEPFKMINIAQTQDKVLADNLESFYLVKNRYWKDDFDKIFTIFKEDKKLRLVSSRTFKGLDVYFFINSNRVPNFWKNNSGLVYNIGDKIDFSKKVTYLSRNGWSNHELCGTWTNGKEASLFLEIKPKVRSDIVMSLLAHAFINNKTPIQNIKVLVNNQLVDTLSYGTSNQVLKKILIPYETTIGNHITKITFKISNPNSPLQLGTSSDPRMLGLFVNELTISY